MIDFIIRKRCQIQWSLERSSLPTSDTSDTLHIHNTPPPWVQTNAWKGSKDGNHLDDSKSNLVDHLRNYQEQESRLNPQNHITPCDAVLVMENTRSSDWEQTTLNSPGKTSIHFIKTHYQSYPTPQYVTESRRKRKWCLITANID